MKRINKSTPDFYNDYLRKNSPKEWNTLSQDIGQQIRDYILDEEQNNQCAYTEIALGSSTKSSHIDHFKKRALFPKDTFKWENLVVSCNSEEYGAKHKDKEIKLTDYQNLINPTIENPSDFFHYSFTGKVEEKGQTDAERTKASTTIRLLALNNQSLRDRRATVINHVKNYALQLSLDEIKSAIGEFDSLVESIYLAFQKTEL